MNYCFLKLIIQMGRSHAFYLYCLGELPLARTNTIFTVNLYSPYYIDLFLNFVVSERKASGFA